MAAVPDTKTDQADAPFEVYFEYFNVDAILVPSSNNFSLQVTPQTSVGEIKAMIQKRDGLPVEAQRLIFTGRYTDLADDESTANDNKLHVGSRIFILVKRSWNNQQEAQKLKV